MTGLLWIVPAAPLAGFVVLALAGRRLPPRAVAWVGVGSVGVSAAVTLAIAARATEPSRQVLWTWLAAGGFESTISLHLDALSAVMAGVVAGVGFLIHLYSAGFMAGDEGYSRFFAYMNLFVASMLALVLAGDLLLLFLGWEGVGLCSYLLIGFWYTDPANGRAARKAFIVTRVGDTALIIGLLLLATELGTLDIQELMARASAGWAPSGGYAVAAAALLLGGALGKSAQLPLQTWLPDAMAGPTPTSALIHAATMVTAGVYLIARTHVIFALAPQVQAVVALIGAVTLLVAGASALVQSDIKRVLAYSTISQIGYMFLALGVGAWTAAIFHFMTHAFFKALLFLSAGLVIHALHHEHDIFRMGGLRRQLPVAFWTFLAAACSLAGLPVVTAGFYSKDLILWRVWTSPAGGAWLWAAGLAGVALTALYIFRLVFLVFFGEARTKAERRTGPAMAIPVVVLAVLSLVGGLVETPPLLGGAHVFSRGLAAALPPAPEGAAGPFGESMAALLSAGAFLAGLAIAAWGFLGRRPLTVGLWRLPGAPALHRFWFADWGMDWLYDRLFVRPFVWLARAGRHDVVDGVVMGLGRLSALGSRGLSATQNGRVRWYAAGIAAGTVVFIAMVLWS